MSKRGCASKIYGLVLGCVCLWSATAAAEQQTEVSTYTDTVVIPAETEWNSYTKYGEVCSFDLRIKYNQRFEITSFDDGHQVYHIKVRDKYTNLQSGFSFYDTANYYIRLDTTGIAYHSGTLWKIVVHGRLAVLDVGTFDQDWNAWGGDVPPPAFNLTGEYHDVNALPFGSLSYCDWAQGDFPRLQAWKPHKHHASPK